MGEAEEVERLRLAKPCPLPLLRRPAAELDQTGLVRMQGQRKLRQPIPQFRLEPLGIGLVLKAGNDVVGIAVRRIQRLCHRSIDRMTSSRQNDEQSRRVIETARARECDYDKGRLE